MSIIIMIILIFGWVSALYIVTNLRKMNILSQLTPDVRWVGENHATMYSRVTSVFQVGWHHDINAPPDYYTIPTPT